MDNFLRVDTEHERRMRAELLIGLAMLFFSVLVAVGIEWHRTGDISSFEFEHIYLSTLLGFVALELLPIFFSAISLRSLFGRHEKQVAMLRTRNSVQNRLTQTLLKAYEHQDEPAFEAVSSSLTEFLESIKIEDDYIELKGDWFARELYDNFWDLLLEAQERKSSNVPGISVYVTHSASVKIWKTPQFSEIRAQQARFIKKGGKIFRILLRTSAESNEDDYREAIKQMSSQVTQVWYLDLSTSNIRFFDDHFLTSVDGKYYNQVWNSGLDDTGSLDSVSGCSISITEGQYNKEDKHRWRTILDMLRNKPDKLDSDDILDHKPNSDELAAMYDLT